MALGFFDLQDTVPPTQEQITARQHAIETAREYAGRQQARRSRYYGLGALTVIAAALATIVGLQFFGEISMIDGTSHVFASTELFAVGWCLSLLVAVWLFVCLLECGLPHPLLQKMIDFNNETEAQLLIIVCVVVSASQVGNSLFNTGFVRYGSLTALMLPLLGIWWGCSAEKAIPDVNCDVSKLDHLLPDHCPDVVEWCEQYDAIARYQAAVAEQGRLLTNGEYELMQTLVRSCEKQQAHLAKEQKLQAACTQLAAPVRAVTAVMA